MHVKHAAENSKESLELLLCLTGLPHTVESEDSERFFKKVLGVPDGSSLGGMKPILEGSKGDLNRSSLPQRILPAGVENDCLYKKYCIYSNSSPSVY